MRKVLVFFAIIILLVIPLLLFLHYRKNAADKILKADSAVTIYSKYKIVHKIIFQPVDRTRQGSGHISQQVDVLIPSSADIHSPVFFHLGYEHDLTEKNLVDLFKAYGEPSGVIFVQAEHRGYGQSITGDEDQSVPSYVRISQALADYHQVIQQLRKEYDGPWMAAGYSYGGGLVINFAHKYPSDITVALSSSGVVHWPFMMAAYDRKVRAIFGREDYLRIVGHIKNLAPKEKFGTNWLEREFLIAGMHGMSQYAKFEKMRRYFILMSYLPTPVFITMLHWIDDIFAGGEAWNYALSNSKKILTRNEALTGKYGWRVWRYQQCSQTGIFEISEGDHGIFNRQKDDFIDECVSLFGSTPESARSPEWDPYSMLKDIKVPLVYVSGGMDPWEELGIMKNFVIKKGRYFKVPDGKHCPDRDDQVLGRQVLAEMLSYTVKGN